MSPSRPPLQPWRVAVTRDEGADGPLSVALRAHGFVPVPCPVLVAAPAGDPGPLVQAAQQLASHHWVIAASARAVAALRSARPEAWPEGVRTAAVGPATAQALRDAGAAPPLTVEEGGADPLWSALAHADTWPGRRVLVLTTPAGRRVLAERLVAAGAEVHEVEAYRMRARDARAIAGDWRAGRPDAAIVASPRVAKALVAAVGADALTTLRAVVAIGTTTAGALLDLGIASVTAGATTFASAVLALGACRETGGRA